MKTAEETLRDNCTQWLFLNADEYEINCIVNAMKEYAKESARESLNNAAENAKMSEDGVFYCECGHDHEYYNIDKQSILSDKNIPEL